MPGCHDKPSLCTSLHEASASQTGRAPLAALPPPDRPANCFLRHVDAHTRGCKACMHKLRGSHPVLQDLREPATPQVLNTMGGGRRLSDDAMCTTCLEWGRTWHACRADTPRVATWRGVACEVCACTTAGARTQTIPRKHRAIEVEGCRTAKPEGRTFEGRRPAARDCSQKTCARKRGCVCNTNLIAASGCGAVPVGLPLLYQSSVP